MSHKVAGRTEKRCPRCGRTLPIENFHKSRRRGDGRKVYCIPCWNERVKERRKRKPEVYRAQARRAYKKNRDKILRRERARTRALKLEVLRHYGGPTPKCACCGETHVEFLQIDHINNDGAAHRKRVGEGTAMYRHLKRTWPEGYRVLCANCNWSRGIFGYCPHTK